MVFKEYPACTTAIYSWTFPHAWNLRADVRHVEPREVDRLGLAVPNVSLFYLVSARRHCQSQVGAAPAEQRYIPIVLVATLVGVEAIPR